MRRAGPGSAVSRFTLETYERLPHADGHGAQRRVSRPGPEIRPPFGTRQFVGQTLELPGPDAGKGSPPRHRRRPLVEEDRDASPRRPLAEGPGRAERICLGTARATHEGNDVQRADAGVPAPVPPQVHLRVHGLREGGRRLDDRLRSSPVGEHHPVVVRIGRPVDEFDAADSLDRGREASHPARVAALAHVGLAEEPGGSQSGVGGQRSPRASVAAPSSVPSSMAASSRTMSSARERSSMTGGTHSRTAS